MRGQEHQPGWFPHPAFASWAASFEEKYGMVDFVMLGDRAFARKKAKQNEGRYCLFCQRNYPKARFDHAAHVVPRMIGNSNLYSLVECDDCNALFSAFETDLSSFLGLSRSITGLSDDKKAPGFPGIGVEAKSFYFKGRKVTVIKKEDTTMNMDDGCTTMNYHKPTYIPSHVHKLFLKCALSVLPQEEVMRDYPLALAYLQGSGVLQTAHVDLFRFPPTVNMPLHIYIYKRKNAAERLPAYIVSFYFGSVIASIPVILHRDDLRYFNQPVNLPMPPPYFVAGNDLQDIKPIFNRYDLSSPLPLKAEPEAMTLQFEKEYLANAAKLDTKTGDVTQSPYNPSGSRYFIATERGTSFTKEDLIELTKEIENRFETGGAAIE